MNKDPMKPLMPMSRQDMMARKDAKSDMVAKGSQHSTDAPTDMMAKPNMSKMSEKRPDDMPRRK